MISGALSQTTLSGNSSADVAVASYMTIDVSASGVMTGKITIPAQSAQVDVFAQGRLNNSSTDGGGTAVVDVSTNAPVFTRKIQMTGQALIEVVGTAVFDNPTYIRVNKNFYYKIYDASRNYISTLRPSEVSTDFTINQDINSAGSEVKFTLKRDAGDYGINNDIKHGNTVDCFVSDKNVPNGKRIFSGYIYETEADYVANEVKVTLHGFGDEFADYVLEGSGNPATTSVPFFSVDPAAILRSIMDKYIADGGVITYDSQSITNTGTVVSYTFNANTLLEGVNKVLELCPENWYWYIDQATNKIHLHKQATVQDHTFVVGRHLTKLSVRTSVEPIANRIYFMGGGEPQLYKKYSLPLVGAAYKKRRSLRVKDARVTVEETADIIAQRSMRGVAGVYINLGVGDDNITNAKGYDIESVQIGQMIRVAGINTDSQDQGISAHYDLAQYDMNFFDYDAGDVGTQIFQIVTKNYTPNELTMQVSNVGFDIAKRTGDIKRNLKDEQFADTPATPDV